MSGSHLTAVICISLSGYGCGILGPSCVGRQKRGTTHELRAEIGPAQVTVHRLSYDTSGSQNDIEVGWSGESTSGGPGLRFYATKAGCETAPLSGANGTGDCRILASAGGAAGVNFPRSMAVTHGRGNPEVLGTPPEYKVWVIGDPTQGTTYTLKATWFYGPDC